MRAEHAHARALVALDRAAGDAEVAEAVADGRGEHRVLPGLRRHRHDDVVAERAHAVTQLALLGGDQIVDAVEVRATGAADELGVRQRLRLGGQPRCLLVSGRGGSCPSSVGSPGMREASPRSVAIALVESELDRLRGLGPDAVRALAAESPVERETEGIVLATRVQAEDDRLLVLVDARRGRRMLATGGFAMHADGSTHTPH